MVDEIWMTFYNVLIIWPIIFIPFVSWLGIVYIL